MKGIEMVIDTISIILQHAKLDKDHSDVRVERLQQPLGSLTTTGIRWNNNLPIRQCGHAWPIDTENKQNNVTRETLPRSTLTATEFPAEWRNERDQTKTENENGENKM